MADIFSSDSLFSWLNPAPASSVPTLNSQPSSDSSWFGSLADSIKTLGSLGTTAANVANAVNPTTKNTTYTPTAAAAWTWIPLAIAAAAVIGIIVLLFRRKR